jgi:hypothetical protein
VFVTITIRYVEVKHKVVFKLHVPYLRNGVVVILRNQEANKAEYNLPEDTLTRSPSPVASRYNLPEDTLTRSPSPAAYRYVSHQNSLVAKLLYSV